MSAALAIAGLLGPAAGAQPPAPGEVGFSVQTLFPKFRPEIHDYVVRCNDAPVTVATHASAGWEAAINNHAFRRRDYSEVVPLGSGRSFRVTFREVGSFQRYSYFTRCLPDDFPNYTFARHRPVSPKFFAVDPWVRPPWHYAADLRQPRRTDLVEVRLGLRHPGASDRECPLAHKRQVADPPARREPHPHPERCRGQGQLTRHSHPWKRRAPAGRLRSAGTRRHERVRGVERCHCPKHRAAAHGR